MAIAPKKPRISSNAVTLEAAIALYSNSPERYVINPNYTNIIPAYAVSSVFNSQLGSDKLGDGTEDEEEVLDGNDDGTDDGTDDNNDSEVAAKNTPQLSDIFVISNEVVFDSAGIPTAKVVFKLNNSSGKILKGVNARIQSL